MAQVVLVILVGPLLLNGCAGTKYVTAPIEGSDMVVPLSSFEIIKNNETQYRRYVVVQNDTLQFPICVYRISAESYTALWMKCTHQGTELHAFGDRLQCPAHGSEFTKERRSSEWTGCRSFANISRCCCRQHLENQSAMKKLYLTLILSSLIAISLAQVDSTFDKTNAERHVLSTFYEHGCDL